MYAVTDRFLAALRKSHTSVARAELYRGTELINADLPVIAGQVTDDSQALVRRRLSVALPGTAEVLAALASVVPDDGGLWPLGNELKVYAGIEFEPGDQEVVPLGVFRISKPVLSDSANGVAISIDGYDRGRAVSRARFTEPYVVAAGTNYATAIKDLIKSRLPTLTDADFVFMTTTYTTPQLVFTSDDDPMDMALKMAGSLGAELFFDGNGKCALRPEPDPLFDPPVFAYEDGETSTLTGIGRDLDDEQAYNGVIVISENSELATPLRAEAWDTNQNSPTYYDPDYPSQSLYGAVPYFINSQYITTQQQCQDAADANLARVLGIIEKIQFEAVNNPAHTSGDIITVGRSSIGATGVNILDSLTIGFGGSVTMTGATRKRRSS